MENFLGVATVPAITGIVWVLCALIKKWIPDDNSRIIPTVAAALGLVLGALNFGGFQNLNEVLVALASGLAATGVNELAKLFKADTQSNEPVE